MIRLFIFLAALILYLAPPVAPAFAASHVRPPGAALVQPTSVDTEGTSVTVTESTDNEWTRGEIAAWIQAVGTILAFVAAIFWSSRDHRRSIQMFAEESRREEGIRHLRAHSLAHALYPDLLEVKEIIKVSEAAISRQRAQKQYLGNPKERTKYWKVNVPEGLRSASEMFYLLGTDTAPVVSQLLSLLHQHNRAASVVIEGLKDEKTFPGTWSAFVGNELFANRFRSIKENAEEALDLVGKIRKRDLLPKYILEANNDQKNNVVPDGTGVDSDDEAPS